MPPVTLRWSAVPRETVLRAVERVRGGDVTEHGLITIGVPLSLARASCDPATGMADAGVMIRAIAADLGLKINEDPSPAAMVRAGRAIRAHFSRIQMRNVIEADVAKKRAAKNGTTSTESKR
jgi:hypothetical protein